MKVLVLNFEKTWRGGERQTLYNMQGFRKLGLEVVLACRQGTPMSVKAKQDGFKVNEYDNVFGVVGLLLLKGRGFDVIHVQTSHMLTYAAYTKPFHGSKIVFTRRVNFQPHGFFTRLKYQLSDRVIAISQSVKRVLHNFGIREVSVISDIVMPRSLDKLRAEKEFKKEIKGKRVVATMAALSKDKDPLTMVEAIRYLSEKRKDFVFLHFGSGDMEPVIKEKITEYKITDVYQLVGFYENVEDFLSIADIFVMSSEQEGLGSIVLDAFIHKVPVVATKAGGMAELIENDRGVGCEVKAAQDIAEGVNMLLDNSDKVSSITEKAYEYVIENHSMDAISHKYLDIFNRL
ncbi:MAG: glycosyltransferase family 4 protein [Flavipsychrobacter sp.]